MPDTHIGTVANNRLNRFLEDCVERGGWRYKGIERIGGLRKRSMILQGKNPPPIATIGKGTKFEEHIPLTMEIKESDVFVDLDKNAWVVWRVLDEWRKIKAFIEMGRRKD